MRTGNELMRQVINEIEQQLVTERMTLRLTKEEKDFVAWAKDERGCSINSFIRYLLRRRIFEYETEEGQLVEVCIENKDNPWSDYLKNKKSRTAQ